MGWTRSSCTANGLAVSLLRTGERRGEPVVVFLHGLLGSGACWMPVARALQGDYDVILPDARGHGGSKAPEGPYRYEDLAADVLGLLDALALDAPVLVGHSMGGLTAALVASRASRRLRGLVLVDPTFLSPERQREVYASDVARQHQETLRRSKEEVASELRARHPHRPADLIEHLAEARLGTDPRAMQILAPPNPDFVALVDAITTPTLLVLGDAGVVTVEAAEALATRNPRLEVARIPRAGHGIPYDHAEPLAALVRGFLTALPARRAP